MCKNEILDVCSPFLSAYAILMKLNVNFIRIFYLFVIGEKES